MLVVPSHRNSISWIPQRRFIKLGGFGNLAGRMDFWDVNKNKTISHTYKVTTGKDAGLRGNTALCTVEYPWSPLSRMFPISTTIPRMNVYNGVCINKYNSRDVTDELGWDNTPYLPDRLLEAFWDTGGELGGRRGYRYN